MKQAYKRLLSLSLVLSLWAGILVPTAAAAGPEDLTAFGSGSVEAQRTLAWTNNAISQAEAKALINSETLHPQKTGWKELDQVIENLLAPCAGGDAYTKLQYAYDFLVKKVVYSWEGYSKTTAPAYEYFTRLNYLKNLTRDEGLKKSVPDDMANRTYHILTTKKGICYDYAIALAVIARYIGIESYVHTGYFVFEDVSNGTGHHGWTVLVLGGQKYVFDAQRDARNWLYYGRNGYYFGIPSANTYRYVTTYDASANAARDASMLSMTADPYNYSNVTVNVEGKGAVSGAGTYLTGTTVTVTATPDAASGSRFLGWYDRNNTFLGKDLSYTWALAGNTTIYARFGYQITAAGTENGTVSGGGSYVSGSSVTLTATPKEGYSFAGWYDGGGTLLSKDAQYTFAASKDLIAQARFVKTDGANTVTVQIQGDGKVLGGGLYALGDTVTLTATPDSGAAFLGWYDRLGRFLGDSLSYSWTLAGNTTVTAKFGVTLTVTASSTGTVSGGGNYAVGDTALLTATPQEGYRFTGWYTGNGQLLSRDDTYSHTVTKSSLTVVGMFSGDDFYDVEPGDWYYDSVRESVRRELITGTTDIHFSPDAQLTRAQVATILARMDGADLSSAPPSGFTDVSDSAWYAGAVNWAYDKGIVNGVSDTRFGPNDPITRQDFVVMLMRYLKKCWGLAPEEGTASFTDMSSVRSYAVKSVQQAVGLGLIDGYADGTFRPEGKLLRKEGVKVFVLLDQQLDQYREDISPLIEQKLQDAEGADQVSAEALEQLYQFIADTGTKWFWQTCGDWDWSFGTDENGTLCLYAVGPEDEDGRLPMHSLMYTPEGGVTVGASGTLPKETDEIDQKLSAAVGADTIDEDMLGQFSEALHSSNMNWFWTNHKNDEWQFLVQSIGTMADTVYLYAYGPMETDENGLRGQTVMYLRYVGEDVGVDGTGMSFTRWLSETEPGGPVTTEEDALELLVAARLTVIQVAKKVESPAVAKFCKYIAQEGPEGYLKTHWNWEWSFVTGPFEGQVSLLAKGPVDSSSGTYPICSLTYYEEDGHIEESEHELAKEVVVPKME